MPSDPTEARRLFAGFLERHPDGEPEALEKLLRSHPDQRSLLEGHFAEFARLRELLDLPTRSIAAHLRAAALQDAGGVSVPATPLPRASENVDLEAFLPDGARSERRYEVLGEVARGGMGVILKVWDRDLRRTLAMKVAGIARKGEGTEDRTSSRTLARFLEEAQITGQLDHPGVVPVHELGIDKNGRLYFTMRLVRGQDLEAIAKRLGAGDPEWPLARVLGVVQRLCETVAYAHSKRVVHRDLKPANIMVGRFGEVYLMDWGLARVLEDGALPAGDSSFASHIGTLREDMSEDGSPLFTQAGDVLGTPAYMAPEQAFGHGEGAGPAADVYSLGAVLYRLLGGRRPYDGQKPLRAAEYVAAVLSGPPVPLHRLAPHVPRELVAISEKAMERDPARRYASAQALADDLRAYLEGRVVGAYRTGPWQELVSWVRRHRELAGAAGVAAGLLVALGLHSRGLAQRVLASNVRLVSAAAAGYRDLDPTRALYYALRAAELDDRSETRSALLEQMEVCHEERYFEGAGPVAIAPDGSELAFVQNDRPGVLRRWSVAGEAFLEDVHLGTSSVLCRAAYSPDGAWIVVACGEERSIWRVDRRSGSARELADGSDRPAHDERPESVAIDPRSRYAATGDTSGRVRLWRLADGAPVADLRDGRGFPRRLRFLGEGSLLAVAHDELAPGDSDGTVRVWSVPECEVRAVLPHDGAVRALAPHPRRPGWLLTGTRGALRGSERTGRLHLWEHASARSLGTLELPGPCWDIELTPEGRFAIVSFDAGLGALCLDEVSGLEDDVDLSPYWQPVDAASAHSGRAVVDLDPYPWREGEDRRLGAWFASAGYDDSIRQWSLRGGGPERVLSRPILRGHLGRLGELAWFPDGRHLLSLEQDTTAVFGAHVWRTDRPTFLELVWRPGFQVNDLAFDGAGEHLCLALGDPEDGSRGAIEVHALHGTTGGLTLVAELSTASSIGAVRRVLATEDGSWLAAGERGALSWDGTTPPISTAFDRAPQQIALDPRTSAVARIDSIGQVQVACFEEGGVRQPPLAAIDGNPYRIAFSSSGAELAVGTSEGTLLVLDARLGETRARHGFAGPVEALLARPDGTWIVNAGDADLWEGAAEDWRRVAGPVKARDLYLDPARGELIWTGRYWGEIHMLDDSPDDFRPHDRDRYARTWIADLAIDASGEHMVAVTGDGTADAFHLPERRHLATFGGHRAAILSGAISPDGRWAATGDCTGRVFVWPVDPAPVVRARFPVGPGTGRVRGYDDRSRDRSSRTGSGSR